MTDGTSAITTIHVALMAVLAVLAIAAIGWGMRLSRRRRRADHEVEVHAEEAGVDVLPADAEPAPATPAVERPARDMASAPAPGLRAVLATADPGAPAGESVAAHVPDGPAPHRIAETDVVVPSSSDPADGPVTQIKGLGPRVAARLSELGIDRVGQIAALDDAAAARLDADMGPFTGRIVRDRWVEQACLLAAGDREGFERVFGRL